MRQTHHMWQTGDLYSFFYYLFTRMPFVKRIKKNYIKPYYWKILNMPKFVELMTTENVILWNEKKQHFILIKYTPYALSCI